MWETSHSHVNKVHKPITPQTHVGLEVIVFGTHPQSNSFLLAMYVTERQTPLRLTYRL